MNLTEMEQKVREATSNDPWGASGTLKQELAQATHNLYVEKNHDESTSSHPLA